MVSNKSTVFNKSTLTTGFNIHNAMIITTDFYLSLFGIYDCTYLEVGCETSSFPIYGKDEQISHELMKSVLLRNVIFCVRVLFLKAVINHKNYIFFTSNQPTIEAKPIIQKIKYQSIIII